jgi:pimeloyl-ACP methyl ester carboxylesterase
MHRKIIILLLVFSVFLRRDTSAASSETSLSVELRGKAFPVLLYRPSPPDSGRPLLVFSSGDGGWRDFEHKNGEWLSHNGYWVLGVDMVKYIQGPVAESDIVDDYRRFFAAFRAVVPNGRDRPIILIGYSFGAELIVPLSVHMGPDDRVSGLILIGPGERGSFMIRVAGSSGVTPGRDTSFLVANYLATLGGLPLLFLHGELDRIGASPKLYELSKEPKRLSLIKGAGHLFHGGNQDYLNSLREGMRWIEEHSRERMRDR